MVMRIRRCQDISVGRNQRSLFWSSKTLPDWRMSYLEVPPWIFGVLCETPLGCHPQLDRSREMSFVLFLFLSSVCSRKFSGLPWFFGQRQEQPHLRQQLVFWRCHPSPWSALTSVVSTANWAPPNRGNPSTTTSNLLPPPPCGRSRSRSRKNALVVTRPPASRQMRAATFSTA